MKNIYLLISLLFTVNIHARTFDGDFTSFCTDEILTDYGNTLLCPSATGFAKLVKAKKGSITDTLPKKVLAGMKDGISDFGLLPDADTNHLYRYTSELIDDNNKRIGFIVIDGYNNTEMEIKLQLTHRYNLSGGLVSAKVH